MDKQFEQFLEMVRMSYLTTGVAVTHPEPIRREFTVPATDGSALFVYAYFPSEEGVFPVIVQRNPYANQGMDYILQAGGEEFAKRGYIYLCQHCRGTGRSEGTWEPHVNERADGLALLDWLCEQPWCGNVGLMGDSYLSMVGWAVADQAPSKVKSMFLGNYGVDRFSSLYQDGMLRHDVVTAWTMENAGFPVSADYLESCLFRPHIHVDEMLWGGRLEWYRSYLSSPLRSDPLWNEGLWKEFSDIPKHIRIPLYISDQWYDHHLGSALYSYENLNDNSRAHSVLRIGGTNHFGTPCLQDREIKNMAVNAVKEQMEWFELTLKQEKLPKAKVYTYLINRDVWREWDTWPLPADEKMFLAFSAEGDGNIRALAAQPQEGVVDFVYDPENPVPSHGAESMLHTKTAIGSLIQPEPGWREDVVSFLSSPLDADREIAGRIKVTLQVSTDAPDTAFTAKVIEVMPDGRAYNIRSTIAVISAQHDHYTPGETVPLTLEMWDINWMLSEGSRLRVDVSSSDFPQYSVHPNLAGPWYEQTENRTARQKILCGCSCIEIPVRGR